MALNKKVTDIGENETKYHRIKNLSINFNLNEVLIEIENYTSKEYREKAKSQIDIKEKLTKLISQYESAIKLQNHELEAAILEKLDNLRKTRLEELNIDYSVGTSIVELNEIPEELTLATFYNKLLETPIYKGAKEV